MVGRLPAWPAPSQSNQHIRPSVFAGSSQTYPSILLLPKRPTSIMTSYNVRATQSNHTTMRSPSPSCREQHTYQHMWCHCRIGCSRASPSFLWMLGCPRIRGCRVPVQALLRPPQRGRTGIACGLVFCVHLLDVCGVRCGEGQHHCANTKEYCTHCWHNPWA